MLLRVKNQVVKAQIELFKETKTISLKEISLSLLTKSKNFQACKRKSLILLKEIGIETS